MSDCETKLSAARTKLILDKPFLGALVLRLPMIEADSDWCKTVATDARAFYYNADYIDDLSVDQTQFVLAHEALHCALSHFARRQHRDKYRWDLACDLAINPLLIADGLKPVPDALFLPQFEEMTAEEIYPCLDEHEDLSPHDDHLYDEDNQSGGGRQGAGGQHDSSEKGSEGGDQQQKKSPDNKGGRGDAEKQEQTKQEPGEGEQQQQQPRDGDGSGQGAKQPPPLSKEEMDNLSVQWQQRMAGAAQQAMQAGKLSGPLRRIIDHLLQPQLPWRMLLARYLNATARDDYNYSRPSRREGDFIMPSLKSHELDVVVALDTSGSVTDKEMTEFVSEVNALKGQIRARVTLLVCDSGLLGDGWAYEPWEEFDLPQEFKGGGSTDFRPVFDWVQRENRRPDVLVYFTDAQGHFPEREPPYPTVWLIKGKAQIPWGQRIQLN
ncbi:MAG: VWA-like domain-containing protein [Gammaproteobacteria bacterium]|nr:VWA-like domain-containing protein [Gammaproteobacteria bacterium]MCW8839511.1 VWA-like domain-containing protein [Gammaproteobacteria bacterium]MCW8927316.1 VWA-like domain-containing protein [Gammaproteobacteria bacterium]MCW8959610.1 VWA-like domain-containing protein [Gammaproteobacteria bacterium]MCW8973472.1 VWA-like domain-containing protein [Gammaproteobacteria bacterium]